MTTSIDGLISGLSTSDTIAQLMAVEKQSQTRLSQQKTANDSLVTVYQALNSRMLAIKDAATAIKDATGWQAASATTSDITIASASASSTALAGSLTFRVDRLASAHSLVSSGSLSSTSAVIATPNSHFLVSAASSLGFSQVTGSNDLSLGEHTIAVTQASAGAQVTSNPPLGTTITLLPHTTVEVATDGTTSTTQTITLDGGTYTRDQLVTAINNAAGGTIKASFTNDGRLQLATTREGSASKLAITGGSALSALNLSVSGAAVAGTDGIVTVDGQATTVSDVNVGSTVTLNAQGGGSVTATFGGGLRAGSTKSTNVSLGDGTLASVTSAINSAGSGFRAATVQVSSGNYRLQIAAINTGTAGQITSDVSVFDAATGGMQTLAAATDAQLTVGSGASSYKVTSSSNKAEILPGVTVTLNKAAPTTDVTLNVATSSSAIAAKVQTMVDSVNNALTYISSQSGYDASTKKGGPLLSDNTARSLQRQLYDLFGASASTLGIKLDSSAKLTFDQAKFIAAYEANPVTTQAAFTDASTGLATKTAKLGADATDSVSGMLTTSINNKQALSKNLADQVANWDTRLALRESGLRKTFSNLEVALGKMQSQSNWLSGQLANLPKFG